MSDARPVRILVMDLQNLLGEITERVLSSQSGFIVRSLRRSQPRFEREIEAFEPHVVILDGTSAAGSEMVLDLLFSCPRPTVLAICRDGRGVHLYRLTPERLELGEASPERLVSEIRKAALPRVVPLEWKEP